MKPIVALVFVLLMLLSRPAFATDGFYASVSGGLLTFDDGVDTIKPKQLSGRLGYNFNDYIGIGFEGGFSLLEDELFGFDWDVTTTFIYLRGSLPISETASIYLLAGPTDVSVTGTSGAFSITADDDDTGTGFGFETRLDTVSVYVDYITYNDNEGVEVDAFNIGVVSYFH
ncbi:MAG: porin family protein [Pseudomonadota bacterium]